MKDLITTECYKKEELLEQVREEESALAGEISQDFQGEMPENR